MFPNEQSLFYGLNKAFVNTSRGNLTFLRRDLVTAGRVPIVIARVYDSGYAGSPDFGPGWHLSDAETLTPAPEDRLILLRLTGQNGDYVDVRRDGTGRVIGMVDDLGRYRIRNPGRRLYERLSALRAFRC